MTFPELWGSFSNMVFLLTNSAHFSLNRRRAWDEQGQPFGINPALI
jgi:hypothetical protein